ncbi:MAG: High-affinity zinc uptake system ATP-binding protein ZnuC [Chlamydiia bacterium]|nr:High-affinity zinc uptake system ATP-binding protein ZnuC [Chlamydiia bacterium]MCH9616162.1 High-affinity zinc uptake system ATP-binding protein ZnuC [Chlamydiia bacterium]MCH9629852.1 High-affinity zinc uptake system ATP-binding protein ZnuC [Chlamydiia bacterium]
MIEFNNVNFSFDSPVLQNATFKVQDGEFIGVVGPNGGGKTTALKLILGLLKRQDGQITRDCPLTQIGYVPQHFQYDPKFPISVREVVLTGCVSKVSYFGGVPTEYKEKAMHLLEQMNLVDFANTPFGHLSGGQAQRTLIARSLICDPKLLILDEPTANIDQATQDTILEFLQGLDQTILMVTHDFDMLRFVDRVLLFQRTVTSHLPSELCKHFSMGIYHPPGGHA